MLSAAGLGIERAELGLKLRIESVAFLLPPLLRSNARARGRSVVARGRLARKLP
jgi:hypothetical protein